MQTLSITITIEAPDDQPIHVETQQPPHIQTLYPPDEPPATNLLDRQLYARQLLHALKFQDPDAALAQFSAERIIDVCTAARANLTNLANPAGFIHTTLRRGWNVSGNGSKSKASNRLTPTGR